MSRRGILYILIAAGVIVFVRFALASENRTGTPVATTTQTGSPFPVEESTVRTSVPAVAPSKDAGKSGAVETKSSKTKSPHKKDAGKSSGTGESSNLTPDLRARLEQIVKLYASWPGTVSKKTLIRQLELQKPYITNTAIEQIKQGWALPATTFKLTVKGVDLEPGFIASSTNPNSADIMAYVRLKTRFTPVSGAPYVKSATRPYDVKLRIIKRRWTVVGIAPQSASAPTGG
jgi:hypothetical protein